MYPQPGTGELRRIEHWNVSFLPPVAHVISGVSHHILDRSQATKAAQRGKPSLKAAKDSRS